MISTRILVCVKAVPAAAQVQVDGQFRLCRDGASLQWNIADESALECALRLRGEQGSVTVLSMGPSGLEEHLRELLARGADEALLVTDPAMAGADTHATARALAAAAEQFGPFDLILCGRRAVDGETGQVPGMLAAALGVLCVTNVDMVTSGADGLIVERRLEAGAARLHIPLPAVISVCEYTWPLRLPSIMGKRKARQSRIQTVSAAQLGLSPEQCGLRGSLTKVVAMSAKFPGLRNGSKETNLAAGAKRLLQLCREVGE